MQYTEVHITVFVQHRFLHHWRLLNKSFYIAQVNE